MLEGQELPVEIDDNALFSVGVLRLRAKPKSSEKKKQEGQNSVLET